MKLDEKLIRTVAARVSFSLKEVEATATFLGNPTQELLLRVCEYAVQANVKPSSIASRFMADGD
jgi:hypothetical protein